MNESTNSPLPTAATAPHQTPAPEDRGAAAVSPQPQPDRGAARRWWIKLLLQPLLFLACGAALLAGLGVAQRLGWLSAGDGSSTHATAQGDDVLYICPMMCTPPQKAPGRCPVCGMELVPATSMTGGGDGRSVRIDPAARRVANIRTAAVESAPITRTIRAIGELNYDEGGLKTISAYVDGRLDRLYADYTGVVVEKGDRLALLYSPELYAGQAELLVGKKVQEQTSSPARGSRLSSTDLYAGAKEKLLLLGMTEAQIAELERAGKAESRIHLTAPISGTVIEKLAVEGQYVKEGDPIYRLADLSTVWLMLRLFPEDAATVQNGQEVEAEVQSLPGRKFTGRVAFIDPNVDPKTRTVGVRVVIPNEAGLLRVGDYAEAGIQVPQAGSQAAPGYDPELAIGGEALVVPRDAVLMAGKNSVVYVETEPGRFEIRRVVLGPSSGDKIVIHSGLKEGEQVATRGNFLIDSQMQLAGNPSLIDPARAQPRREEAMPPEVLAALARLSPEDRALVDKQRICPVAESRLGSMGTPKKVDVQGTPVFICCEQCRDELLADPEAYLAKLAAGARREKPAAPATHQH